MDPTVRRSQVITTYGVGAMVATMDLAVMVAGLEYWPVGLPDLHEPRLEKRLGVQGFVKPPAGDDAPALPAVRFPELHHCPECHRLAPHWVLANRGETVCRHDGATLIPSRFVVACAKGHIADFPYTRWLHRDSPWDKDCRMELTTSGVSATLRDIWLSCSCGVARRSMDGAFEKFELSAVARCQGKRPWLDDAEDCGEAIRTLQRGASNVWFAQVRSALSIPPWSEAAFDAVNRYWSVLRTITDPHQLRLTLDGMGGERVLGRPVDEIVHALIARREDDAVDVDDDEQFRLQEYRAIVAGRSASGRDDQFVAENGEIPSALGGVLGRVVLAHRLREVRVLEGFSRLEPPGEAEHAGEVAPLSRQPLNWLPGIEVRGEGLFLELELGGLAEWERDEDVVGRVEMIRRNHAAYELKGEISESFVTPRLVLLHTLAHALIDALSLDAGYPAASLRERLYVGDEMAGLLIYTATSDSAGSLGGIVAQGEPLRFEAVFRSALARASWCSADPVCIESTAQGVGGMNLAACHACSLLPETSCEHRNVLLDRGLLTGWPARPDLGFFSELAAADG